MKKKKYKIAVAAVMMIAVGLLFVLVSYPFGGRPVYAIGSMGIVTWKDVQEKQPEKLKTVSLEKTKLDSFENIEIYSDFGDILIEEGEEYSLEYFFTNTKVTPFYEVRNGTFTFRKEAEWTSGNGYEFYVINMGLGGMHGIGMFNPYGERESNAKDEKENYIRLTIPENCGLGNVTLHNSNGSIKWEQKGTAEKCLVENDFADIWLSGIQCKNMKVRTSNGVLKLSGITAVEGILAEANFRETNLDQITARELEIRSFNGKVKLEDAQITEKISVGNDFGRVELKQIEAEELEIRNSNGDTEIKQLETKKLKQELDFGSTVMEEVHCITARLDNSNGSLRIGESDFEDFRSQSDFVQIDLENSSFGSAGFENNNGKIRADGIDFDALEVNNSCGDVNLNLNGKEAQYDYELEADFGEVILNGGD